MNRLHYCYSAAIGTLTFLLFPLILSAGLTVESHDGVTAGVDTGGYKEFHVVVHNDGFLAEQFYVRRTSLSVPSPDWSSTICMESFCYDYRVDSTGTEQIFPNGSYNVFFTIYAGYESEDTGHFRLDFISPGGDGTPFYSLEFEVTTQGVSTSVPSRLVARSMPFPNPANHTLLIPVEDGNSADRLEVVDVAGNIVIDADLSRHSGATYALSTESMATGTYFYRLRSADGTTGSGSFQVAH